MCFHLFFFCFLFFTLRCCCINFDCGAKLSLLHRKNEQTERNEEDNKKNSNQKTKSLLIINNEATKCLKTEFPLSTPISIFTEHKAKIAILYRERESKRESTLYTLPAKKEYFASKIDFFSSLVVVPVAVHYSRSVLSTDHYMYVCCVYFRTVCFRT